MKKMLRGIVLVITISIVFTGLVISSFADSEEQLEHRDHGTPAPTTAPTPAPVIDGAALYNQICARCHGQGERGKSVSAITHAINSNFGGMISLKSLTAEQIAAISAY